MHHHASKSLVKPLLLAGMIGSGALGVWLFASGIVVSIVDQWRSSPKWEYLEINGQGEAIIRAYQVNVGFSYRDLAGQPVTDPLTVHALPGTSLPAADAAHFQNPLDWPDRILSIEDAQMPPNFWYLMREGQPNGHAYFVGFNSESKQQVGYLGLAGFRSTLPPREEQFVLSTQKVGGNIAGNFRPGAQPYIYATPENEIWTAYLISGGKLFQVNFKLRTVQPVPLPEEPVSVEMANQPISDALNSGYRREVAIRTTNQIIVMDYEGKTLQTILVPAELRDQGFDLFAWWKPQVVMVTDMAGWVHPPQVYWVNDQGQIARHETVILASNPPADPRLIAWGSAFLLPAPLIYAPALLIGLPLSNVFDGSQPAYAAALTVWWNACWPALVTLCVLGIALSIYVYGRHQRVSESGSLPWAVFIALMGLPGLIGYVLHRARPATEKCAHCGAVTSRNRDTCLLCNTEFPLPPLKSIEIFA
ncbi:MAG TPA: hypothetical protein VFE46_12335 [Pirellulales bacterium]|jgi:hypothetical protein|nr:hypothetical protein [Pirellulales bacterium]